MREREREIERERGRERERDKEDFDFYKLISLTRMLVKLSSNKNYKILYTR